MNAGRKVYVCTDHDRHYPVGAASIVIAWNETQARELLDVKLIERGLKPYAQSEYTLEVVETDFSAAFVLVDGNY